MGLSVDGWLFRLEMSDYFLCIMLLSVSQKPLSLKTTLEMTTGGQEMTTSGQEMTTGGQESNRRVFSTSSVAASIMQSTLRRSGHYARPLTTTLITHAYTDNMALLRDDWERQADNNWPIFGRRNFLRVKIDVIIGSVLHNELYFEITILFWKLYQIVFNLVYWKYFSDVFWYFISKIMLKVISQKQNTFSKYCFFFNLIARH